MQKILNAAQHMQKSAQEAKESILEVLALLNTEVEK